LQKVAIQHYSKMLRSKYYTENELQNYGFKSLGKNIKISSDCRIYGAENISLGNNIRIDDFTILVAVSGFIKIENYVFIAKGCHLSGAKGIILNDFSSMAANTIIYSASDDYSGKYMTAQAIPSKYTKLTGGLVNIGKHVIIGSSCNIFGPSIIGEGCSIGTMSLIMKDTEPWGIYAGIPAKRIKDRSKDLQKLEADFLNEINNGQ
jgi:acetyltransferase-like isoleucine patch superfamily enzyme